MDSNTKITIDWTKKTATFVVPLTELRTSATGDTAACADIRNEAIGQAHPDGRPLKLSLRLYVKNPKA